MNKKHVALLSVSKPSLTNLYLISNDGLHPDASQDLHVLTSHSISWAIATITNHQKLDHTHLRVWIVVNRSWSEVATPWQPSGESKDYHADVFAHLAKHDAFTSLRSRYALANLFGNFDIKPIQHLRHQSTIVSNNSHYAYKHNVFSALFLSHITHTEDIDPIKVSSQREPDAAIDDLRPFTSEHVRVGEYDYVTVTHGNPKVFGLDSTYIVRTRGQYQGVIKEHGVFSIKNGVYLITDTQTGLSSYLAPRSLYDCEYLKGMRSLKALEGNGKTLHRLSFSTLDWVNCAQEGLYYEHNLDELTQVVKAGLSRCGIAYSLGAARDWLKESGAGIDFSRCLYSPFQRHHRPTTSQYLFFLRWLNGIQTD